MPIALDATYSTGDELTGVGIYSREILSGLSNSHPDQSFRFCYRAHRWMRSFREPLPANATRSLFGDQWILPPGADLFHGLNQRMPATRFRRSVCTFHDLFVITGDYSSPEFRRRFLTQAREAAERTDLVIAVSAFTASQVETLLGVERSRIRVVHHGIRSLPVTEQPREPMVLHVGAIQHRKNIVRLVHAFEHLEPSWRLVLAGSANGYGAEEALAAIRASHAAVRIEVTGYVTPRRLAELYAKASIFAFPSLDEGFGMPILEAMSRGVPVVASTRSALPEVCGEAALAVEATNTEALAFALKQLSEDEPLRQDYSLRGLQHAAGFTWESAVSKTWSIYRELLPSPWRKL